MENTHTLARSHTGVGVSLVVTATHRSVLCRATTRTFFADSLCISSATHGFQGESTVFVFGASVPSATTAGFDTSSFGADDTAILVTGAGVATIKGFEVFASFVNLAVVLTGHSAFAFAFFVDSLPITSGHAGVGVGLAITTTDRLVH